MGDGENPPVDEDAASATVAVAALRSRPWHGRLRCALRAGAFVVHYQPIVAVDGGEIAHHEALVRLADQGAGRLTAPGAFLPAAERHGLAGAIDRLVVDRVVAMLGDERAGGGSGIVRRAAVNMSARSVAEGGMLDHVERLLERHRVDPGRLIVELTETAAIRDMRRARAFCEGLEELGCAVALDDFGVGFGSLRYAKHLPFDYLKIDGDFVRGLTYSEEDRVVVRAIVDLARGLGGQTIAECVGDDATLRALRELGVDYAQGFRIGRPGPM